MLKLVSEVYRISLAVVRVVTPCGASNAYKTVWERATASTVLRHAIIRSTGLAPSSYGVARSSRKVQILRKKPIQSKIH